MPAISKASRRDNKRSNRPKKHREYDKKTDKRKTIQIERARKEKLERLEGEV